MRILVDQSGYDLTNIGDVAMLQSCVLRLRQLWPIAEIMVISHSAERLEAFCPGTAAVARAPERPVRRFLLRSYLPVCESATPYLSGRLRGGRAPRPHPRTAAQAVHAADLVVAAGGGYLTDTFRWHATGVLSVLSLAQRLGKPTAMFGQGIGPISQRMLRVQARAALPRVAVLGLREDRMSRGLALSLGAPPGAVTVTGDDALELVAGTSAPDGGALGVNMRVCDYAGVDPSAAAGIGHLLLASATALQAPIVALPVSRGAAGTDLRAIRALLRPGHGRAEIELADLMTPEALIAAAGRCRAVVTGSYHAAVFAVAQGVPAVCLTRSSYYDAKFCGLRALFPSACFVVPIGQRDAAGRLRTAISEAWHLPLRARAAARQAASRQCDAGRAAYAQFRAAVEDSPRLLAAGHRG